LIQSFKFAVVLAVLVSGAAFATDPVVDMIQINPNGGIVTTLQNDQGDNIVMTPVIIERNPTTGEERVTPMFASNGLGYSLAILYGRPTGLSVSAGIIYGLQSDQDSGSIRGIMLEGTAGLGGGGIAVGLISAQGGVGSGYSLTLTRIWGNPSTNVTPGQTFVGIKYEWSMLLRVSAGMMYRVAGPDVGGRFVATFGAGIGLYDLFHRDGRRRN